MDHLIEKFTHVTPTSFILLRVIINNNPHVLINSDVIPSVPTIGSHLDVLAEPEALSVVPPPMVDCLLL